MSTREDGFKDSGKLTAWVKYFLYLQIAASLIAIVSGVMEYQLLSDFENGRYASQQEAIADGEANDRRQQVVSIFALSVFIVSGFLILKWIHRANYNARQLGAQNMDFTPGWSIGWYFVPIALLWKPYQAMKEIWKASHSPDDWTNVKVSGLLPWWWFLWLVNGFIGQIAFRFSMGAQELDQLMTVNILMQIVDITGVPLSLITLAIIVRIYSAQTSCFAVNSRAVAES